MKITSTTAIVFCLSLFGASALAQPTVVAGTVKSVDFDQQELTIINETGDEQRFFYASDVKAKFEGRSHSLERVLAPGQTVELTIKPSQAEVESAR